MLIYRKPQKIHWMIYVVIDQAEALPRLAGSRSVGEGVCNQVRPMWLRPRPAALAWSSSTARSIHDVASRESLPIYQSRSSPRGVLRIVI